MENLRTSTLATRKKTVIVLFFINFAALLTNSYSQPNTVQYDGRTNTFYSCGSLNYNSGHENSGLRSEIFNWQMVQAQYNYFINTIFFTDSLHGWATHNNGGVYKTTNSGFNWSVTQIASGIGCICGVYFINRDTGWICGSMGKIRKTINSGLDWIKMDYLEFSGYYYSIFFNNYNTGFISGSKDYKGFIIKTTNSGENWQQIFLDTITARELYGQYWLNKDTAFFYGSSIFLKTTNGGISFINYYPNLPPTSNGSNALLGMYFVNEQTGWISGSNVDFKNMYKTTDGGLSWIFQDNPVAQYQFPQLDDVIFKDENTGWAGAYVGQIIATTNGGNNWFTDLNSPTWFSCFAKYKTSKVWCGAHHSEIWYLDNLNPIGIQQIGSQIPEKFLLSQNYPNPFNSGTIIEFHIPKKQTVIIIIYDLLGKEIETLTNKIYNPGSYKIDYNSNNIASGVYFYVMKTDDFIDVKKLVLIK